MTVEARAAPLRRSGLARDTLVVTGCTLLSRLTGFARVLVAAAALGNGLYANGACSNTRVFRNNMTASRNGIVIDNATNLFVGFLPNPSVGNLVQYNQVGLFTTGTNTGTGVMNTTWFRNVRRTRNAGNVAISPAA